jgi:hypothetical protein
MGHVDFLAAVAGLPSSHVFELENETRLDNRRKAALPFARKLTRTPEAVGPEDIKALSVQFSDKQIVQLVFAICHFNTMNRLADAFGVPLEKTNVFAPPPKKPAPEKAPPPATAEEPARFPPPAPEGEPAPLPK